MTEVIIRFDLCPKDINMEKIIIYFDGLCEPVNPGGTGCYGYTIEHNDSLIAEGKGSIGKKQKNGKPVTNNIAEYSALIFALQKLNELNLLKDNDIYCYGDSKLVVQQISGNWQCNKEHLQRAVKNCLELLQQAKHWDIDWVPRERNVKADRLSQDAYEMFTGKKVIPRRK